MTLQYDQGDINLRDASPINVTTIDANPFIVDLDTLTDNGQSLTVKLFGGGSAPGALAANNYAVNANAMATYVREAGAGALTNAIVTLIQVGGPVDIRFGFTDTAAGTVCQLSILAPVFPYVHRLKISKIRF